jgi:DNA (cytosine-5)-methyltransferase 1
MACKWQVEIDPYAQRVLAKHWPDVRRHDDVKTWPQPDTERVDVIAGGFPCQDISYAGKGAGLAGERSGLFYEVARIVREMGPRVVVLENVAALLTRGMGDVLGTLASLGYDAEWHCIPAAAVGAPHIRDRVFLLAYAIEQRRERRECSAQAKGWKLRQSIAGEDRKNASDSKGNRWNEGNPNGSRSGEGIATREKYRSWCRNRRWAPEPAVGRVADGVPSRVDRLRGLGNAVVPQVAEFVGRMVVESLNRQPD